MIPARVGFVGQTPQEIRNSASSGRSVAIYNGMIYDVTTYLTSPLAIRTPTGTQPPGNQMSISCMEVCWICSSSIRAGISRSSLIASTLTAPSWLARRCTYATCFSWAGPTTDSRLNVFSPTTFSSLSWLSWWPLSVSKIWHLSISVRHVRLKTTTDLTFVRCRVIPKVTSRCVALSIRWPR